MAHDAGLLRRRVWGLLCSGSYCRGRRVYLKEGEVSGLPKRLKEA